MSRRSVKMSTILFSVALFFWFGLCSDQTRATVTSTVTFDGIWWQSMSHEEKLIAVQGILVGYEAGYRRAAANASNAIEGIKGTKFYNTLIGQSPSGADLTFEQTVNRIDQVYIDHPDLRSRVAMLFVDCSIIESWSCEVTVKNLDT